MAISFLTDSMEKRTDLTLARKIQMLEALDQGKSQREVADAFDVTQACVSKVKKNRADIQKNVMENHSLSRKRKRDGRLPEVDKRVFAWFCHQRNAKADQWPPSHSTGQKDCERGRPTARVL